ncbi:MAG TPA: hypothetical protein VGU71_22485 [Candidatus Dormibacteraeota bacterium]|nr:hypothetical protein [Candidatus Dormibacteraeota bacterium]
MNQPPASARVSLYGVEYTVDLEACRVRMLERVAELRNVPPALGVMGFRRKGGMQAVAEVAGVDRATLRRFFEGRPLTVETFTAIITRGLQLDVRAVAKPHEAVA